MLQTIVSELPNLYTLKDMYKEHKDEYDNYSELYLDLVPKRYQLVYIDDSHTHFYARIENGNEYSELDSISEKAAIEKATRSRKKAYGVGLNGYV